MVYQNHIAYRAGPGYENETFRARHGYKESEAHDAPYRRNRDFKPVPYGSAKGILNYRHSEPFALMKNLKDLPRETHQKPIVYTKHFLKGAITGGFFGYLYFACGPVGYLETEKVIAASGSRPFSGQIFRYVKIY